MNDMLRKSWIYLLGAMFILCSFMYLFKYTMDQGWITDPVKIGLGLTLGFGCAIGGLKWIIKQSLAGEIVGTKGRIEMHNPFYRATELTLHLNSGETEKFSFPHEVNGFEYEIREVMDALSKGFKECPSMPHTTSLLMAQTMDKIREQCGIVY